MSDRLGHADPDATASTLLGNTDGSPAPVNGTAGRVAIAPEWAALEARYELRQPPVSDHGRDVCLARDRATSRGVQIVRLHDTRGRPAGSAERFLDRARAVAAMNHPRLVRVCDFGHDEFGCYFVTEAPEAECLADLLGQCGPLDVETVAPLARELTGALAEYHRRGLVHAHLSPASIFVDDAGDPRLLDSGLLALGGDEPLNGRRAAPADLFRAPELREGSVPDARSDVWSVGAVLCQLLTGRTPGTDGAAELPGPLDDAIRRALAAKPADRFPSAFEFHCAVCEAIGATPSVEAGPPLAAAAVRSLPVSESDFAAGAAPQPIDELASTPSPVPVVGQELPTVAMTENAAHVPSFGTWYGERFGWTKAAGTAPSYAIQALVWGGLGFVWIPAWYLATRGGAAAGIGR